MLLCPAVQSAEPMPMKTPVALFVFKRPDTTRRVLDALRYAKPSTVFVVADGPRADRPGEKAQCMAVRELVENMIDWPCTVEHNYSDENLGCKRRVASGLDWVFSEADRAIILEDDCVPEPSFFPYCEELLERYASDQRVMTISGNNFHDGRQRTPYSYFFSRYMHCWGWASWRRAWQHFDLNMRQWPEVRDDDWLSELFASDSAVRYWKHIFDHVYAGDIDSWAYIWQYSIWLQAGLSITPEANLVSNIGFGNNATHTHDADAHVDASTQPLNFPLRHPPFIIRHRTADRFIQSQHLQGPLWKRAIQKVRMIANGYIESVYPGA